MFTHILTGKNLFKSSKKATGEFVRNSNKDIRAALITLHKK